MNLEDVKQILDLVREHDLAEFELEREGWKIRVRKDARGGLAAEASSGPGGAAPPLGLPVTPAALDTATALAPAEEPEESLEFAVVKSPIVGTFYRAAEPGTPPFVEIGARVKKGQVLCIIEAMKLMNEIESEYDGEVVKVYVENGQPVQYGERLFAIKAG
jgi:acetyl-CoA carboxylase biotin carboxyl carrier protein